MPSTSSRPSTRELLGGRWAISLRTWLISTAMLLIGVPLGFKATLNLEPQTIALISVVDWLIFSALYLGAHLTVFRHRRTTPVHVAWLVVLGLLFGIARSATIFALPECRAILGDGWSGALTVALCFTPGSVILAVLVTYLVAITDWYATERTRLLRFEVEAEAARLRAIGALNAARAVITTRIQTALEERLNSLERAAKIDGDDSRLSDSLLDTAADYVRPESHLLWLGQDATPRRSSLGDLDRASLSAPLPIALPYVLWVILAFPTLVAHYGALRSLPNLLALLVAMTVLYRLGRTAIRRYAPAPRYLRARLIALVTMLIAGAIGTGVPVLLGTSSLVPLRQALVVLFLVAVTTIVSWTQAALRTQEAHLSSMRTHAEESELERLALEAATEQMQRELALYLHGTVQAGLVASAYTIQDAVNRGDNQALEAAIADARFAISQVGEPDQRTDATDLATLAQQHDAKWRGLIAITWRLPSDPIAAETLHRIGNVIQECLANASIHGAASEATVRVVVESDCVIVEITDNGSGLGDGKPGLGSAVLNEATHSQWTIASVPTGGAQVRAVVPV